MHMAFLFSLLTDIKEFLTVLKKFFLVLTHCLNIFKKKTPSLQYIEDIQILNDILTSIQNQLKASRVSILQFKDGEKFQASSHIWKLLVRQEKCVRGLKFYSEVLGTNTSFSQVYEYLGPILNPLLKQKAVDVNTCSNKDAEYCNTSDYYMCMVSFDCAAIPFSYTKTLFDSLNTHTIYAILLKNKYGDPIGILDIQYTDPSDKGNKIVEQNKCFICQHCFRIKTILEKK